MDRYGPRAAERVRTHRQPCYQRSEVKSAQHENATKISEHIESYKLKFRGATDSAGNNKKKTRGISKSVFIGRVALALSTKEFKHYNGLGNFSNKIADSGRSIPREPLASKNSIFYYGKKQRSLMSQVGLAPVAAPTAPKEDEWNAHDDAQVLVINTSCLF